jgi:hypothetical protein
LSSPCDSSREEFLWKIHGLALNLSRLPTPFMHPPEGAGAVFALHNGEAGGGAPSSRHPLSAQPWTRRSVSPPPPPSYPPPIVSLLQLLLPTIDCMPLPYSGPHKLGTMFVVTSRAFFRPGLYPFFFSVRTPNRRPLPAAVRVALDAKASALDRRWTPQIPRSPCAMRHAVQQSRDMPALVHFSLQFARGGSLVFL